MNNEAERSDIHEGGEVRGGDRVRGRSVRDQERWFITTEAHLYNKLLCVSCPSVEPGQGRVR